ncbi:MAG TPA: STAS domain-containing protein [Vicinamibacterales bacterium]|jgi:anti-sigma B factor antagonist|nr:STAS domain-containing protein [Vicinamibacterales bacterium]
MNISQRIVGNVAVIDLSGRVTLGEGTETLRDKINSLLNQGHRNLILNLSGVDYVDSAGLGEIVSSYATVRRNGGSLKLVGLTSRIRDLLSITKLLTVFDTFDAEQDAVRSFSSVNA